MNCWGLNDIGENMNESICERVVKAVQRMAGIYRIRILSMIENEPPRPEGRGIM
jgi:hypothetical protein